MINTRGELDVLLLALRKIAHRIGPGQCDQWIPVPVSGALLSTSTSPYISSKATLLNILFQGTDVGADVQADHLDLFWSQKPSNLSRNEYLSRITSIDQSRVITKKSRGNTVAIIINFSTEANCDKRWIEDGIDVTWQGLPLFVRGAASMCNGFHRRRLAIIDDSLINSEVDKHIASSGYQPYTPHIQSPSHVNVILDTSPGAIPSASRPLLIDTRIPSNPPTNAAAIITPHADEQQDNFRRHQRVEVAQPSPQYLSNLNGCLSEQTKIKDVAPTTPEMRLASYFISRQITAKMDPVVPLPHIEGRTGELRCVTMLPIKRKGERSTGRGYESDMVLEIVEKILIMAEHCGIDLELIYTKLGKQLDPNMHVLVLPRMTREEEIDWTIAAMNKLNVSSERWHEYRMFHQNTFLLTKTTGVKLGAPTIDVRLRRRALAPRDKFYHGSSDFKISADDSRTCQFWYAKHPMQMISSMIEDALNNGEYEPSPSFCGASESFSVVITNIDRDTGTIGFIIRLANWKQGNSAHKCRTWAEIDGASECYDNLSKFLRTVHDGYKKEMGVDSLPANPIHTVSQHLYDDKIIEISMEVKLFSQKTVWLTTCILNRCRDSQDVPLDKRSPDAFPEVLQRVEVDDEKYQRDCPLAHITETANFSDLRLIVDRTTKAPIGLGTIDPASNEFITWSTFSSSTKSIKLFERAEITKLVFRRIIGGDSGDGKMALMLIGSAGASSTYNCPKCAFRNHDGMENIGKKFPLRRGSLSPEKCYHTYISGAVPVSAKEKKDRSLDSYSITKEPIFRIDPDKLFGGTMHWRMGNTEKIDSCSVSALNRIEQESGLYEFAVEESVAINREIDEVEVAFVQLQDDIGRRRSGISDMRKRIIDVQRRIEEGKGNAAENVAILEQQASLRNEDEASLRSLEKSFDYLRKHSEALQKAAVDLESYLHDSETGNGYLVLLLNESYTKAANVPLQGYFGGRTLIGRHVARLLERYPLVCDYFSDAVKERCGDFLPADKIDEALKCAAECMVELDIIAVFAESQRKITQEERNDLLESLERYEAALKLNYPDCHVSTKMHSYLAHLVEALDYWANVGRFNEQGFEAVHAFVNSFRNKYIRIMNPELKADQVRQEVAARKSEGAIKLEQASEGMRTKRRREQKDETKEKKAAIDQGWIKWSGVNRNLNRAETEAADDDGICEDTGSRERGVPAVESDDAPQYDAILPPDDVPIESDLQDIILCPDCDECVCKKLYLFHRTGRHGDCPNFHLLPEPLPQYEEYTDSEDEESSGESHGDEDQRSLDNNSHSEEEFEVVISGIQKAKGHVPMLIAELRARGVALSEEESKSNANIKPLIAKLKAAVGEGASSFIPISSEMIQLAKDGKVNIVTND